MADISELLLTIKNAVYGEDMRTAIHNALEKINIEGTEKLNSLNNSSYKTVTASYDVVETSNEYEVTEKTEVEI